jgi:hypothetical protein
MALRLSHCRGRKAVRLNSGVRLGQERSSPKRYSHWQRTWLLLRVFGFLPCSACPNFWRGTRLQSANAHRMSGRRDLKFALAWSQMVAPESSWPQPNNSFKPRPLRGSACAVTCTTPPRRKSVRLNSGVRAHAENRSNCHYSVAPFWLRNPCDDSRMPRAT